jgi:hypothetical protein
VDIGILLHTNDQAIQIERRNQYMVDLTNIIRKEIHPVIFNSAGEELMRRIFSTGKYILVKDEKQLSLFKMIIRKDSRLALLYRQYEIKSYQKNNGELKHWWIRTLFWPKPDL